MELQEQLKQQAIALGLCEQWQQEWGTPDTAALCDKYIRGLDFCIKHDYPTVEFMQQHFKGKVEQYGIYINDKTAVAHNQRNVVLNGDSDITVEVDSGHQSDITVRHNSTVRLIVGNKAFVYVSLHDNSRLIVLRKGTDTRIAVSHFGGTIATPELVDKVYKKGIKK